MNIKNVVLTLHAKNQFRDRYNSLYPGNKKHLDFLVMELAAKAKMIPMSIKHFIKRANKHKEPAEYYATTCGWRFVVVYNEEKDKNFIVTIEHRSPRLNYKKRKY